MIDEAGYCRMPRDIAKTVSDGVEFLNTNTAGGRVKFKTDSNRIAIMIKMKNIGKMPHFAYTGSTGLDFYYKQNGIEKYGGSFIPNIEIEDGFGSYQYFENDGISEITLNLPLYSGVTELLIGVNEKLRDRESGRIQHRKTRCVLRLINNAGRVCIKTGDNLSIVSFARIRL